MLIFKFMEKYLTYSFILDQYLLLAYKYKPDINKFTFCIKESQRNKLKINSPLYVMTLFFFSFSPIKKMTMQKRSSTSANILTFPTGLKTSSKWEKVKDYSNLSKMLSPFLIFFRWYLYVTKFSKMGTLIFSRVPKYTNYNFSSLSLNTVSEINDNKTLPIFSSYIESPLKIKVSITASFSQSAYLLNLSTLFFIKIPFLFFRKRKKKKYK